MRGPARFIIGPAEWIIYNFRFIMIGLFLAVLYKLGFYIFDVMRVAFGYSYTEILEGEVLNLLVYIDAMMVATVGYLIVIGSYLIYIKPRLYDYVNSDPEDRPSALSHLDPNILKKYISGSLVTISAVKLVRLLLEGEQVSWNLWIMSVVIHIMFMASVYLFMKVSIMHAPEPTTKSPEHH